MNFDRRLKPAGDKPELKPVELPLDYLKIVEETMLEALAPGLEELKKHHPICELKASGALYSNEVLMAITISHGEKSLVATTVYASADFNPMMQEPGIEVILNECLDSAGAILTHYLNPKHPDRISEFASASIGSLEDAPFEWSKADDTKVTVFVKIDKSNPALDSMADDWLKNNDPEFANRDETAEAEDFLNERLEAIRKVKGGGGSGGFSGGGYQGGDSGPIRH
jgi:hypothetical protein